MSNRLLVINAGHGGADAGAPGKFGLQERDINYRVCMKFMQLFSAEIMPRILIQQTTDKSQVVSQSNKLDPAIFVSVHCNASGNKAAHGLLVYHRGDEGSARLARCLYKGVAGVLDNESRWSKIVSMSWWSWAKRFTVLKRSTAKAAALVELDFISNDAACEEMNSAVWIDKAAAGLAVAVKLYLGV